VRHEALTYILYLAEHLANHSDNAYLSRQEIINLYGSRLQSTFDMPIPDSSLLGFVPRIFGFVILEQNHNVISFRGTQKLISKDTLLTDLRASMINIEWLDAEPNNPRGHRGFVNSYNQVRRNLINRQYTNKIYVTGHSLGGALATLAALDLKRNFPNKDIVVYTFASPKVGDSTFATLFNNTLGAASERVFIEGDLVPRLPPQESYEHVRDAHVLEDPGASFFEKHKISTIKERIADEARRIPF
jgi:triacylglycerol lipase